MEFNTLDAQREACEAYILSQRSEGWQGSAVQYDDGGFSGGNLDRPALKQLLDDIKAGKINIVVVYKIDRLTRSLTDFSKLVEVFDEYGVTFVSVTQSFNTTTSMGRLTLNVLLSFAQFEREVTGERIRDKIAASKRRGMWMGGTPPAGYRIENRQLVVEETETELVHHIFDWYLKLGSVRDLKNELDSKNIISPKRMSLKGKPYGGKPFSRGGLYAILKNPAYIGKIPHKDKTYEGLHDGIIDDEVWQAVQTKLQNNTVSRKQATEQRHILQGLIYDVDGTIYSPTYTKRHGRQYHYYISQNLLQYKDHPKGILARLPAHEIEKIVERTLRSEVKNLCKDLGGNIRKHILKHQQEISWRTFARACIKKVTIGLDTINIKITPMPFKKLVKKHLDMDVNINQSQYEIAVNFKIGKANKGALVIQSEGDKDIFDMESSSLKKLVQGTIWREEHFDGMMLKDIAKREKHSADYIGTAIYQSLDFGS